MLHYSFPDIEVLPPDDRSLRLITARAAEWVCLQRGMTLEQTLHRTVRITENDELILDAYMSGLVVWSKSKGFW